MPLTEQLELFSQKIRNLDRYQFLLRPAIAEGQVGSEVIPIRIAGEESFPDQELLSKVRFSLARMSGKPIAAVLNSQESRLHTPAPAVAVPSGSGGLAQRPPVKATPPPVIATPQERLTFPHLDEEQHAFLRFLINNPDMPVSVLYQHLSLSWRKGNQLREYLMEQGFITELEGRSKAGRSSKVFIPTLHALELLGVAPPEGRGGAVHRHIQNLVTEGATAKGYSAKCAYDLGNGGIVDVHLKRGEVRVAVEVAVFSLPQREIAHIRHCLHAGYTHGYTIFVNEHLLTRTQEAMQEVLSAEELAKVRLLPLSKLSHLG
jgi:hypothetical protein